MDKDSNYEAVGAALKGSGAEGLEVLEWKELFPEIIQTIEVDMAGGRIFVTILYFIISFVLLGTVIMMVAERQREFGIFGQYWDEENQIGLCDFTRKHHAHHGWSHRRYGGS